MISPRAKAVSEDSQPIHLADFNHRGRSRSAFKFAKLELRVGDDFVGPLIPCTGKKRDGLAVGFGADERARSSLRHSSRPPAPSPSDPTLKSTNGIVGGSVRADVLAPGGSSDIVSATWFISGSIQGQSYRNGIGKTTAPTRSVTVSWQGRAVSGDSYCAFWDDRPGIHTLAVSVAYKDGTVGNASATVSVTQPTVDAFRVTYGPTKWIGAGFASNRTYGGTVSVPKGFGGEIAIIQMVAAQNTLVTQKRAGGIDMHSMATPGFVLDNDSSLASPTELGHLFPGSVARIPENGVANLPDGLHDSPLALIGVDTDAETGALSMRFDNTFQDFLVYRAPGGIWVRIAETGTYTVSGEAKWVGSFDNGIWEQVAAPSPAVVTTLSGRPSLGFVSWTDCASPKYTRWNRNRPAK